jgi:hypothetical protein
MALKSQRNFPATAAAKMSERLEFSASDRVDDATFNRILWTMMKGSQPPPEVNARAPLQVFQVGH